MSTLSEEQQQDLDVLISMEGNGEISDTDSGIILHSGKTSFAYRHRGNNSTTVSVMSFSGPEIDNNVVKM